MHANSRTEFFTKLRPVPKQRCQGIQSHQHWLPGKSQRVRLIWSYLIYKIIQNHPGYPVQLSKNARCRGHHARPSRRLGTCLKTRKAKKSKCSKKSKTVQNWHISTSLYILPADTYNYFNYLLLPPAMRQNHSLFWMHACYALTDDNIICWLYYLHYFPQCSTCLYTQIRLLQSLCQVAGGKRNLPCPERHQTCPKTCKGTDLGSAVSMA